MDAQNITPDPVPGKTVKHFEVGDILETVVTEIDANGAQSIELSGEVLTLKTDLSIDSDYESALRATVLNR